MVLSINSTLISGLELDFSLLYGSFKHHYSFFHQFFSAENIGLKSFKVLSLKSVSVSGKDVEYLLSNAPVLERLEVHDSPDLVHLRVSGNFLALEHLEIIKCEKLESVKICQVNIVSLYFEADIKPANFNLSIFSTIMKYRKTVVFFFK